MLRKLTILFMLLGLLATLPGCIIVPGGYYGHGYYSGSYPYGPYLYTPFYGHGGHR